MAAPLGSEADADMHSELVLGDLGERLHTFVRLLLCLCADAVFVALWIGMQLAIERYTSNGIVVGAFTYSVSANLRLVLALVSMVPAIIFVYADVKTLFRKAVGATAMHAAGDKELLKQVQVGDDRLPLECPPAEARDIYLRRIGIFTIGADAVTASLIAVVSTGEMPQLGIGVAAVAVLLALIGYRMPLPFVAASSAIAFSLAAVAALLGTLVLAAELTGLSATFTTLVMLAAIVIGTDVIIIWRVIEAGWADRQSSSADAFGRHYVVSETDGAIKRIELDDRAPTRELVQKAYRAIRRIPGTPQDTEDIKDLESVGRKCWRKYSQILDMVAQGPRADVSLYRKASLAEERVARYCEQLMAETKQLGSGAAPRYRIYSGTAGRRQLKELLLEWNATLSEIIERERELGVDVIVPLLGGR